jgi:hypothetical protein
VTLTEHGNHARRITRSFIPNTRMSRGPMKFWVWIGIKNANCLTNLMLGILLEYVSKTTLLQVQQNVKMKTMKKKDLQNYKLLELFQSKRKRKFQNKLDWILEKVVFNSYNILTTFQESTTLLKNMDKYIATILKSLVPHL